jgi:hypothetical protein
VWPYSSKVPEKMLSRVIVASKVVHPEGGSTLRGIFLLLVMKLLPVLSFLKSKVIAVTAKRRA